MDEEWRGRLRRKDGGRMDGNGRGGSMDGKGRVGRMDGKGRER